MTLQENLNPSQGTVTPHAGAESVPPEVRERPEVEFDKTTLSQAVEAGYIDPLNPPENVSSLIEAKPEVKDPSPAEIEAELAGFRKFLANPMGKVALVAGGVAAAAALFFGIKGAVDASEPHLTLPPASSETDAPAEDPGSTGGEQDPVSPGVEFKAIPVGLETEQLGELFVSDIMESWANASANESIWKPYLAFDGNEDDFVDKISKENGAAFADQYLVDGWESDPELVKFVNNQIAYNANVIKVYIYLDGQDSDNTAPDYHVDLTLTSANQVGLPGDEATSYAFAHTLSNNAGQPVQVPNSTFNVTFKEVNGAEKISAISLD